MPTGFKISQPCAALLALASALAPGSAFGEAVGGGVKQPKATGSYLGSASVFAFSDSTTQGDRELPGGTTMLAFANLQYNIKEYHSGGGFIYQLDKYGTAQVETHYDLKYEFFLDEYYLELAYGQVTQEFKQKSVASREGTEMIVGLGRRVPLFGGALFFDISLKERIATIKTEDGEDLPDPIQRTDLCPYLGLGTSL